MAAEHNPHINISGSVRLVGEVPSILGTTPTTSMPPELSTTIMETTTTLATTTTRKNRSSPGSMVRSSFLIGSGHTTFGPYSYGVNYVEFNLWMYHNNFVIFFPHHTLVLASLGWIQVLDPSPPPIHERLVTEILYPSFNMVQVDK